jgi:hypothetical protein
MLAPFYILFEYLFTIVLLSGKRIVSYVVRQDRKIVVISALT